jgi:hypothetical protein
VTAPKDGAAGSFSLTKCASVAACLATQLFARGVLHPVDRREVLIPFDLGNFLDDNVIRVRCVGDLGVVVGRYRVRRVAAAEGRWATWTRVGRLAYGR